MTPSPGLLPWQALFLACAAGAWAAHDPAPGVGAAILAAALWRLAGRRFPHPAAFALAALLGFGYASLRLPEIPPDLDQWSAPRTRSHLNALVDSVQERPGNRLEVMLSDVRLRDGDSTDETLPGRLPGLMAWTWQDPAFRPEPGSRVDLDARPRPAQGFDNFGVDGWGWRWRLRGVFLRAYTLGPKGVALAGPPPDDHWERWRLELREAILRGAGPGSPGGMVLGLVTGERFAIAQADLERVRRASLAHLLAVSGMNLAAVAALGWCAAWLACALRPRLCLTLPRAKLAVLIGLPLTACYLWLGRFEPSLMRAAIMFGTWGLLVLMGRSRVLLDGLFIALAAMFLWNPLCVFDVGLQLSAAAVAGLVLLMPLAAPALTRLRALGGRTRWSLLLAVPVGWACVTLASQLAVFPIQASLFGEASPHLYLNLLWVPVVEWAAQPLAYLGALTVTWLPIVGEPLLAGSATVCSWMLGSLEAMDARGWLATYPIQRPWWPEAMGWFALLGLASAFASLERKARAGWACLCLLLLAAPPLWRAWDQQRERVSLTLLDVGQGQSALIEVPGGGRYMVDGGGALSGTFDMGRAVLAPALTWGRAPRVEGLVMSHPDRDHTGGFAYLLGSFRVGFLAGNGELPRAGDFLAGMAASGLAPETWREGEFHDLGQNPGQNLGLEVLHPPVSGAAHGNEGSLVLRLTWKGRGLALLPGDAGPHALAYILGHVSGSGRALTADALVAPHHGSVRSLSPELYEAVSPSVALVSAGSGNSYGFPAPAVLDALGKAGARVFGTDRCGAVRLTWDSPGAAPRVETARPCGPE
ncbi:DNA internalization-related competence protein ComEC/Rec2 [Fundidesulfovibrio agrisoli]|uniref:DNA internalization-related competence protein ComEC/Rec2 n=1 Tax=Fundidesulfovibrio agrisoli TaxID=2922717 RepID=UPI001FAB3E87